MGNKVTSKKVATEASKFCKTTVSAKQVKV
jgi:hypothetical protein